MKDTVVAKVLERRTQLIAQVRETESRIRTLIADMTDAGRNALRNGFK